MSDFWKTLAGNSSSQLLTGSMDSLLSGRENGPDFEKMRVLTDVHREANALELPIEAGTKVSFIGTLGAYMGYDNPPSEGSVGEVVPVKSANGDITHNDGKVFVQWDDGEFRSIHAEHLRLASGKTASGEMAVKQVAGKLLNDRTIKKHLNFSKDLEGGKVKKIRLDDGLRMLVITLADQYPGISFFVTGNKGGKRSQTLAQSRGGIPAHGAIRKVFSPIMKAVEEWLEEGKTDLLKAASDIKQQFEKIKGMAEKKPDNDFLKSLLKQMADKGFAPTDKQMAVVKKIEKEIEQQGQMKKELKTLDKKGEFDAADIGKEQGGPLSHDPEDKEIMGHFGQGDLHEMADIAKSAAFRVASLGDLTDFLKVADGQLIHRSTNDLWSVTADGEGFTITRLFDDSGDPLKG